MLNLNKDNISDILYTYNNFHDSSISSINYDIIANEIEIIFDAYKWTKETYTDDIQPQKTKIVMFFKNIEKFVMNEIYYWDFLDKIKLEETIIENKKSLTFADNETEPNVSITCQEILLNSIDLQ